MINTDVLRKKILEQAMRGALSEQRDSDSKALPVEYGISELPTELHPHTIPTSWSWVTVNDVILKSVGGGTPSKSVPDYWMDGDIPWVTVKDFSSANKGYIEDTIDHITSAGLNNSAANLVDEDAIVICMRMALGKIVRLSRPMAINQDLRAVWLHPFIDESFFVLFYSSLSIDGRGMTVSGIRKDDLMKLPFPLPPLEEQHRIVKKINELLKCLRIIDDLQVMYADDYEILKSKIIDAGIKGELTEQQPSDGTAEELYHLIQAKKAVLVKEKIIKKSKPLPEITDEDIPFSIPPNWKWVRLGDLAQKITSGNTPSGGKKSNAYVEEGHCFFREQNIYNDGIHEEGMVYITEELLQTRENSTVLAKDILLNITGGSIGRCALIPDDFDRGSINQHILIIRMVDERLRFYIHRLLCSPYAQKYIKFKSVGDKDGFSGGRCKLMPIPLPPLEEQDRISKKIDDLLAAMPK